MTTLEVWNALTQLIKTAMPDCQVIRCYDVLTRLSDVANLSQPAVYIQLEGVESTPIGSGEALKTIEDVGSYTINLVWKTRTNKNDEYDSILPIIERIAVALRYRKFPFGSEWFSILNPSFGTDGELFDKDVLTEQGVFLTTIGIQTKSRRIITQNG